MLIERKRRLVRNWEPLVPLVPHRKEFPFTESDQEWNVQRKDWLRLNFADTENWRLAKILNTQETEVAHQARLMHLHKSDKFLEWEKLDSNSREKGCPAGYHFETDEEYEQRVKKEREQVQRHAEAIARGFDFCTKEEKELLVAVLIEALIWGKETQPDFKYNFDYWN